MEHATANAGDMGRSEGRIERGKRDCRRKRRKKNSYNDRPEIDEEKAKATRIE